MPLNQADQIAVRPVILTRVTSVCVGYALYLLGQGGSTAEELTWARGCMDSPNAMGERVSWYVLDDPNYVANGSGITDAQLQAAGQTAINTYFIGG